MEDDKQLKNFNKEINAKKRTKKRKKIIKNVFNWETKTEGVHIYK